MHKRSHETLTQSGIKKQILSKSHIVSHTCITCSCVKLLVFLPLLPFQDTGGGVLETRLYLRKAMPDSFRSYTLVAENNIGTTTHNTNLMQSKLHNQVNSTNSSPKTHE